MLAIDDIFKKCGNLAELARDISVPYETVAKWSQRKRIPSDFWGRVIGAAERRGHNITYPQLAKANKPRKGVAA